MLKPALVVVLYMSDLRELILVQIYLKDHPRKWYDHTINPLSSIALAALRSRETMIRRLIALWRISLRQLQRMPTYALLVLTTKMESICLLTQPLWSLISYVKAAQATVYCISLPSILTLRIQQGHFQFPSYISPLLLIDDLLLLRRLFLLSCENRSFP